jgi:hypothetical protein
MPQLTSEQQDAVQEAISRQLYRINNLVKGMFGQELSEEEIRRAHGRVMQGVMGAMRQMEQQRPPTQTPTPTSPRPVNPADLVEGGFVNDASGQATAAERQRLGIR